MNNPDSIAIINRFYEAIDKLIANKVISGKQTFTNTYDINRRNFITVKKNPQSDIFQLAWISYLVNDFGVSSEWMLTGNGNMFKDKSITVLTRDNKAITLDELQKFDNLRCEVTYRAYRYKATHSGLVNVLFNSKTKKISLKVKTEAKRAKIIRAEDIISINRID